MSFVLAVVSQPATFDFRGWWVECFYAAHIIDEVFHCFGSMWGTIWEADYPISQRALYSVLYTGGFTTLICWIWVPGDLLLANAVLQITTVSLTGTTAHAWLCGMRSVANDKQ